MKTKKAMGRTAACVILLLAFLILQPCQGVNAADWYIVPRLEIRGEYDSNINWTFEEKIGDYILNVDPSFDVNYESNVSKFRGRVRLNGQIFADNSNLDTINQYYYIDGQHRVAPRLALTFEGNYAADRTLRSELEESGLILNRTEREAFGVTPGIGYDFTPRLAAGVKYGFYKVNYQDPRYSDYFRHGVELNTRHLLRNQKTAFLATVSGRYVRYPDINNTYRNLGTYAGVEHKFSEEWLLVLRGGANFNWFSTQTAVIGTVTDPDFIQVPLQSLEKRFSVSPFVFIQGTRTWPKTGLNFSYSLNQWPAASGAIRQFHNVNASINRALGEKFRAILTGRAYYAFNSNVSEETEDEVQRLLYELSPGITYRINNKLSLSASYIYGWRRDIDDGIHTDRHRVWIYLTFAYPLEYKK